MKEENLEQIKKEFEDIEWEKAGFTRAEIEEMDRRLQEQSIFWNVFFF